MNCCLFKKKSALNRNHPNPALRFPEPSARVDVPIECGRCRVPQSVPEKAIVMVCSSCRCVNRIKLEGVDRRVSFIDCDVGEAQIIQSTRAVFQLGENSDGRSIPICSVCLDGVGDVILEHCGHGGICEDCARHIALNKAVGGSNCPLDKQSIDHISRIGELHDDFVKTRDIVLPDATTNQPPRVPPPVGLRKSKGSNEP
jgi:hypothetical protein